MSNRGLVTVSATGLVLAAALGELSVEEVRKLAREYGIPEWKLEKALARLRRQGNLAIVEGRLVIPEGAHRNTWEIARKVAYNIGLNNNGRASNEISKI